VVDEIVARQRRVSEVAAAKRAPRGSDEQLVGDFWFAGMDSAARNREGLEPIKADLARIDRIRSPNEVIDFVAVMHNRFITRVFFMRYIAPDERNSDRMIYNLWQGGLSMNSAQYYTASDPLSVKVREAFREYLFNAFMRLGRDSGEARASAEQVYALEARMASAHAPGGGYQKASVAELRQLAPTIDWPRYFRAVGAPDIDSVNIGKPRYIATVDSMLATVPLDAWKDYLRFWILRVNSFYLDDATFEESFAYSRTYSGQLEPPPRWRRVLQSLAGRLGEPLARLIDLEVMPPKVKARHQAMGEAIRAAFRDRIERLDWMSASTKQAAHAKLAALRIQVGYPENWSDLSGLTVRRDSYSLNMLGTSEWLATTQVRALGGPVDRRAWTPSATMHEASYDDSRVSVLMEPGTIVVPGVPDEELDDAVIYGFSFMGHEISHAFDSEGRHYDARGNRVDWWKPEDAAAFQQRAQLMIDQFNTFAPVEGLRVDGRRTLRENIADLAGLRVSLDAFKKTEQFRKGEKIGGLTPLQRFFLAYAHRQMFHARPELLAARLRNDSHAPNRERVNGIVVHIPEFYEAFDVKSGDRMYLPDSARVKVW
jgi:putative endopeptidase